MTVLAPQVHHQHRAPWLQDTTAVPVQRRSDDDPRPAGRAVLYGSFTCPWSYLASQRTDLIGDPALRPSWRMVDPAAPPGTRLAAAGRRRDDAGAARAAQDLEAVRTLLLPGEHLPAQPPSVVAHAGPAAVGYAEAVGAGVGDEVRRLLFDAYWEHGADIGLPDVLRRVLAAALRGGCSATRSIRAHGYAVTLTGGPVTSDAHRRLTAWQQAWSRHGAEVPALTSATDTTGGTAVLAALAQVGAAALGGGRPDR
jgi:hypothetical protein